MRLLSTLFIIFALSFTGALQAAVEPGQSQINPKSKIVISYPLIVLYSVSWCPHCRAAKEYLTHNNIPFINRDVELDKEAMELLTNKYQSKGVPVIVIGNDEKVLKGFNEENFVKALQEVQQKKR